MDVHTSPEHTRSAFIAIDMQRDFLDGHALGIPGTTAVVPSIVRTLRFFRECSRPIIHVVRLYSADGAGVDLCRRASVRQGSHILIAGSDGSQLEPRLLPSPDMRLDVEFLLAGGLQPVGDTEWIMYKPRWGAFYGTPLEDHLRHLDVSTLVFAGCNFPNCPRTSIYEASERDFRLVVLKDAISGLYPKGISELQDIGAWVVDTATYVHDAAWPALPADSR